MTELRERVANAICLKRYGEEITDEVYISPIERDRCYDLADAAIAAVMQDLEAPSEGMIEAMSDAFLNNKKRDFTSIMTAMSQSIAAQYRKEQASE